MDSKNILRKKIIKTSRIENEKFSIISFYGGKDRGTMIQISFADKYVELKVDEVKNIISILTKWIKDK